MLGPINFLTRHLINVLVFSTAATLTFVNFTGITTMLALPLGAAAYFISNKITYAIQKTTQSKKIGLSKSEYNLIEAQLKQARSHIQALNQQYVRVRSVRAFKQINEMSKLAKRIINIVQTNPQKFYAVEDFFYAHLPSAVQLSDKYTLLTKEQVPGTDVHLALEDTRRTLKDLQITMESDLKSALSSDIENLKIELDFAKLSNEKRKDRLKIGGE
ncbi:5-bromo-4-chloroindolyl phosphate hydrolysis protein [Solibacillus kalamii]|uniref:5-bromo-4-chloroindolyl phosphate hydrolysis protein n=3 Tax=Solibacillus TaxID=648800 RepID=F2F5K3_SOLSS|nr:MULTISPECIES: 5-bromo-4-chloroindolyl phosphate hydrolysis family protein [Solibacillus]AMO85555.1 5-bromo-4-chloroindolyl phosphate hydrolase [Solibacillus silvestris]EKB44453.1 5-bromo-4-chloroindolyl phosphate hydrolysis protein [Solibacillus isronensis B3W22]MBM7663778.1 5-bromo-4-chloroindolyl phosphate hydrolysis protein [Solibacillus kalamii]OBW60454.1 5-bromo-4-chloroindolyl phosphate hydrolase [Solibacillus silvestris]OUZ39417.1 5-bromo-4-chloroindolyl phosphate hydrolase [Solibaci